MTTKNEYVAILAIGPVQSFIASARKSRDLWSGSWLLSEISKAGAKCLHESGAELIFPAVANPADLQENSDFSVGNKIQVVITAQNKTELEELLEKVKQAIKARFIKEVENSRSQLNNNELRTDIWDLQKDDYVEVQYSWAKINDDSYIDAVQKASRILASRKATRDFSASSTDPYCELLMIPKSSLDGVRETVLKSNLSQNRKAKLGLTGSKNNPEQLDCVGVVKRLGFAKEEGKNKKVIAEQFTAFSRICADAWINELVENGKDLSDIKETYEQLVYLGVATRVKGNDGIYSKFPFESEYLYESRIDAGMTEWKGLDDAIGDTLEALKKQLKNLWKEYGQPQRYGVMLLADGDKMGELLDKATTKDEHKAITTALSAFAESVADTMREHRGHCIYAGGDDVLGIVPLDKAYACADELQKSFSNSLKSISAELKENTPTLSVGLAICHNMTPFSVIRDYAKQAESHAKGDHITDSNQRRNALSILLSVRSGNDTTLRLRWNDTNAHDSFHQWIDDYHKKSLPSRVAYSVRDIHLHTQDIAKDDEDLHKKIQNAELTRMLKQARTAKGENVKQALIDKLTERAKQIRLEALADELIVARWFSAKTDKDLGRA